MSGRAVAEEVWRQQSIWSQAAGRLKQRVERARTAALVVAVAVAVLGASAQAVGAVSDWGRVLAGLAALGAALVPLLHKARGGASLQAWTRARSVSEALKSEVGLWLARAGAYEDDASADRLGERTEEILRDGDDLLRHTVGCVPKVRPLPEIEDGRSFFRVRVRGQVQEYYRPKAERLGRRLRWFRRTELTLAVVAAALGALVAVVEAPLAPWIAVVTTVGTAVAVHVAARRDEYQLMEFLRTAAELERLERRADAAETDDAVRQLAAAAEAVISVENQAWMAKLGEVPAAAAPG